MKFQENNILEYMKETWQRLTSYMRRWATNRHTGSLRLQVRGNLSRIVGGSQGADQKKLIRETDWDILVILDACRYDYFRKEYEEFLSGKLIKARSPASSTYNWATSLFPSYYPDVHVVSANAFLNSKGITMKHDYKATDHFPPENIEDVWDWGWDPEISSIHPKKVLENISNSDRTVAWFIQPHGPWIGEPKLTFPAKKETEGAIRRVIKAVRKGEVNPKKFREAYRGNLRLVLEYVSRLADDRKDEKIVVTSDHGELLYDYGSFLHPDGFDLPELREVPFLLMDR